MPISVVAAFLHLGEKYAIPAFVKEAKSKLRCPFDPTSISSACCSALDLFPAITDGDPHNFQIMNLLQEIDLNPPLPVAMYQCIITCPLTKMVDGYQFKDSFYSLSVTNLRSFIRMKGVLENQRIRLAKDLCKGSPCGQLNCTYRIVRLWSEDLNVAPPFDTWKSQWDKSKPFCETCAKSVKAKREAAMQEAWNQLPTAFGFDSWAEMGKSGPCMIRMY